jgi:predicted ATPase
MRNIDITLANYRCFPADSPAQIEIRPRMLALVGPNNSGKSTLLRFFYEFREMFRCFLNMTELANLAQGQPRAINLQGVGDVEEVFTNNNRLPLRIELRVPGARSHQLSGVDITFERPGAGTFVTRFRIGPDLSPTVPNTRVGNATVSVEPALIIDAARQLTGTLYLPSTRVAIGESAGLLYDLRFGQDFIKLWDSSKTGPIRSQNEAIQRVTEDIRALFGFDQLEINATPDNKDLHVSINTRPFKLRELGSGVAQFVIVLANVALRAPSLLLIDEPEISLHPSCNWTF